MTDRLRLVRGILKHRGGPGRWKTDLRRTPGLLIHREGPAEDKSRLRQMQKPRGHREGPGGRILSCKLRHTLCRIRIVQPGKF